MNNSSILRRGQVYALNGEALINYTFSTMILLNKSDWGWGERETPVEERWDILVSGGSYVKFIPAFWLPKGKTSWFKLISE